MRDERGQALVLAVLLMGIAAAAVAGLAVASGAVLERARDGRSGEAAVSAAGAAVGDILRAREAALGRALTPDDLARIAAEPATLAAARSAAARLSREHGRADPDDVRIGAFRYEIEVRVTVAGREHVALLGYEP